MYMQIIIPLVCVFEALQSLYYVKLHKTFSAQLADVYVVRTADASFPTGWQII